MKKSLSWLLITVLALSAAGQSLDYKILHEINCNRNKNLDGGFQFVSNSSQYIAGGVPFAMLGAGFFSHNKKMIQQGEHAIISYAISSIATYTLKNTVRRPRPFETYSDIEKMSNGGSMSFPSGHTSAAFSLATSIAMDNKQWYIRVPVFTWAALVSYSRLHLGVHYPTDVLAGAAVGAASAYASKKITRWLNRDRKHLQTAPQVVAFY